MVRDRRTLTALAIGAAAHVSLLSCSGAEFSPAGADANVSAAGGNASGASTSSGGGGAGKSTSGSSQGGQAGGGATSGGAQTGGQTNLGDAGEPDSGGRGGTAELGFQPPTDHLLYWFSADVGVAADDGSVTNWQNRAENGFDAVQMQSSLRPTLVQADPLPLVSFDGTDDYLELPELTEAFDEGVSIFVVASASATNTCAAFIELSNGSELADIHFGAHGNAVHYEVDQEVLVAEQGSFPVAEVRLVEVHHSAALAQAPVELRVNAAQAGSTVITLPASVPRISNFLGRTLYQTCSVFSGGLAELLFYSRKVSADERTAIELYLVEKWQCCK